MKRTPIAGWTLAGGGAGLAIGNGRWSGCGRSGVANEDRRSPSQAQFASDCREERAWLPAMGQGPRMSRCWLSMWRQDRSSACRLCRREGHGNEGGRPLHCPALLVPPSTSAQHGLGVIQPRLSSAIWRRASSLRNILESLARPRRVGTQARRFTRSRGDKPNKRPRSCPWRIGS